jgi:adenylate kinase family enzyme
MEIKENNMIVINLFAPPGSGKSTGAAYIFSKLKMAGINAELVTEYAKDEVWNGSIEPFKCQEYIFGNQSYRLSRLKDKVDVIITDSPLPLTILYNNNPVLDKDFENVVMKVFNSYDNVNILLNRIKTYNPVGRKQTQEESDALKKPLIYLLNKYNLSYSEYNGCKEDYDEIVDKLLKYV